MASYKMYIRFMCVSKNTNTPHPEFSQQCLRPEVRLAWRRI
jgi:hypothetical protein